jgi:hypothetical protein
MKACWFALLFLVFAWKQPLPHAAEPIEQLIISRKRRRIIFVAGANLGGRKVRRAGTGFNEIRPPSKYQFCRSDMNARAARLITEVKAGRKLPRILSRF